MNITRKYRIIEKLAFSASVFSRIGKLPTVTKRVAAIKRLYRSQGVRPPLGVEGVVERGDLSGLKKVLRDHNATKTEPLIRRGSKVHLKALRDLRAKRFTTLEAGLSLPGAKSLRGGQGPSTPLSGRTSPRDNVVIDDDYSYRNMIANRKLEDSTHHPRTKKPVSDREEGFRLAAQARHKASHGLYMAERDTVRSADYARRAGLNDPKGGVIAQVDLPASLIGPSGGKEYVMPRELLRYARNPRMTKRDPSPDPALRKFYPIPKEVIGKGRRMDDKLPSWRSKPQKPHGKRKKERPALDYTKRKEGA